MRAHTFPPKDGSVAMEPWGDEGLRVAATEVKSGVLTPACAKTKEAVIFSSAIEMQVPGAIKTLCIQHIYIMGYITNFSYMLSIYIYLEGCVPSKIHRSSRSPNATFQAGQSYHLSKSPSLSAIPPTARWRK